MQQPWENDPIIAPAGPVYGSPRLPSPQTAPQAQKDILDVTRAQQQIGAQPLQNESTRVNILQGQQSIGNTQFTQKDKLRSDFYALPPVKEFTAFLPALFKAVEAPDNAQGDLAVLYAFSKSMDPTTGVREGEQAMARATASLQEQASVWINRVNAGERLPPAVRHNFIETMRETGKQYARTYDQQRAFFSDLAKRNKYDPTEIVGPHVYEPFLEVEKEYIKKHGGTPKAGGVPLDGPAVVSGPTEAGFDKTADPRLSELNSSQAAAYDAFWKANPEPTPEQLAGFVQSIGLTGNMPLDQAKAIIEHKKKTGTISHDVEYRPDISQMRTGDEVTDPIARGVADTALLGFSEEAAAAADTLTNDKTYSQNLAFENAVRDYDVQNNFGKRVVGQLGGGAVLPTFGVNTVRGLAGVGAGYGAAYGAGSADGGLGPRAGNALLGGITGAGIGAGLGAVSPLVARGAAAVGRRIAGPATPRQQQILQAGAEEGVPINMGDVYPGTRNSLAALETIPGASGPVRQGIAAGAEAIEGRVQQLGRGGTAREDMGEVAQVAGERFIDKSGKQADRLYNFARKEAAGEPILPNQVKSTLENLVAVEDAVPGGTKAGAVIKRYAQAFENDQPITIDGARAMRSELLSSLREDGGLSKKQATRITGQIMGAVNQDIESALSSAGKSRAVRAYRDADKFYAQRMDEIEDVIERVVGNDNNRKSGDQSLQVMRRLAKDDAPRLTRMLKHLSPDERRDFAATLVEPLGRRSAEEPFSPQTFITNVRSLSPGARRIIFGTDGEKSIQNLVRLSNAKKETINRLNNSRSGQVSNYRTMVSSVLFSLPGGGAVLGAMQAAPGTGAAAGAAVGAAGMLGSRVVAKALMNEEFTRLLAQTPATMNPKAIDRHYGLIRKVAAKDPNVRSLVENIEQQLLRAANDTGATSAAASESGEQER